MNVSWGFSHLGFFEGARVNTAFHRLVTWPGLSKVSQALSQGKRFL